MNSKRAKEEIGKITRFISIDWISTVERAVEIAEGDARERAVRAFCKICRTRDIGREIGCAGLSAHTNRECPFYLEFLKAYDNE